MPRIRVDGVFYVRMRFMADPENCAARKQRQYSAPNVFVLLYVFPKFRSVSYSSGDYMQNHCLCPALKDQGIEEEREKEISDICFSSTLPPKPLNLGSHRLTSQALRGILQKGI